MRLGKGAGPQGQNLAVIPFTERTDYNPATIPDGTLVWEVVDIFTTHDGSWEVDDGDQYGVDQWARDAYLRSPNDPEYNSQGGADHHIQICVIGVDGQRIAGAGVLFSSEGAATLQPPTPNVIMRETETSGWGNIPIFAISHPPAPGPWCAAKFGVSDIVSGIGLPGNWHVSTFIVYRARPFSAVVNPPDPGGGAGEYGARLEAIQHAIDVLAGRFDAVFR